MMSTSQPWKIAIDGNRSRIAATSSACCEIPSAVSVRDVPALCE